MSGTNIEIQQLVKQITTRPATQADINTLLQFEQDLINTERAFDPTLKPSATYYDLPGMISAPHIELIVAEHNDTIVGCGYARIQTAAPYLQHNRYAYFGFMYTIPAWRGRSVNQVIMDELKKWSAAQGITELRLEVYHDNAAAIRAYEKSGFTQHKIEMRMNM